MMRRYSYVGPDAIREAVVDPAARGAPIRAAEDLAPFATGEPSTFVVGVDGILRVADRRSEHVACAGGGEVLFRRCPQCGERNLVKDGWFTCAICESALPPSWNF